MKMKKIISLLVSVCAFVSTFATIASAEDKPTMKLIANKISFDDAAYSSYKGDYDWSEYNDVDSGLIYETYSLKVVATGIEVETTAEKSGKSTIYVGDSIVGYQVTIGISTDATYDDDWKWGLINSIATPTGSPSQTGAALVSTGTTPLEPAAGVAKTITKEDETVILEFLVTVDSNKAVNFTFEDYALFLATYANLANNPTSDFAYKKSENTMTTTTATYKLPLSNDPVEKDEFENVTSNQSVNNTAEGSDSKFNGKYLKYVAKVFEGADATKKIRITKNGTEKMETQRSIAEVLKGVAVDASNKISGDVAIGVLTDNAADVFTFDLF